MSLRIASSSRPSCSISSSLRCMYSWTSEIAMSLSPFCFGRCRLDVERAVAHGGRDAGLHRLVGRVELVAVAQVAHLALHEGQRAGVADAHPAAEGHPDPGFLTSLEDGGGTVGLDGLAGVAERDRAALPAVAAEL